MKALIARTYHRAVPFLEKKMSGESIDYRQIINLIVPILVEQAFIVLLALMNTAIISSSGATAVAAVNMVDSLNLFWFGVFTALATGGTVVVAQYKGAGNEESVSRAMAQSLSSVTLIGTLLGVLIAGFHSPVMMGLFGKAAPEVLDNARIYLIGSAASYPMFAAIEAVCGALRGIGLTRATLWISMIKNGSYVLLTVWFVSVFHWGVWGLVIALLLSRLLAVVASLLYIFRINHALRFTPHDLLAWDWGMVRRILTIGIPFALEQIFFNGGKLLTQTFIVQLGTSSIQINAISSSLAGVPQIGANTCNLAVVTVVGQCMGRRNIPDAKKFVRLFRNMASLSFAVLDVLVLPFLPLLVRLFSPPPGIVPAVYHIVLLTCISGVFLWSPSFVTPSALRAAGDARFTLVTALSTMWLVRVVLGYVLAVLLPFGVMGIWIAMVFEWVVRGIFFQIRLRGSRWYAHRLVD